MWAVIRRKIPAVQPQSGRFFRPALQRGMTRKAPPEKPTPDDREDRLKAALKANLARRKAQARARATPRDQGRDDGDKNKD